ncbi:MAG: hypothetical protein EBT97_10120 [Actinobacteria bacterium]|nr:hypothetical protein [Actinomycetota bacterium]
MRPMQLPSTARRLRLGDTVRDGDWMMSPDGTVQIDYESIWIGTLIKASTPWRFYRVPDQPKVDPMIAATKRIRAKTTLGQLEKLLAERAKAQRRVTLARDRLDLINRNIAKLAQTMAEQRFDSDLNQVTQPTT